MNTARLFKTVPDEDPLGFFASGVLDVRRVAAFLSLSNAEIGAVAGVAPASVRFDDKMPREVRERFSEIAVICGKVAEFFRGDAAKTALWIGLRNPLLGDVSPRDTIRLGRFESLRRFVLDAVQEDQTDEGRAQSHPPEDAPRLPGSAAKDVLKRSAPELHMLCERFCVKRLSVFGSATRPDFDLARSDMDLAVEFGAAADLSPARQYFDFKAALEKLFERPVDLVELAAMPDSRLKRIIERTQIPVYAKAP